MASGPKFRLRPLLSRDLTSDGNRRFALNSVNRFWFLLMGRGLVHPLDMMHKDNPPSHPALIESLASEFIARKFDVRWLLREIALSEGYQRTSRAREVLNAARRRRPRSDRAVAGDVGDEKVDVDGLAVLATPQRDRSAAAEVDVGFVKGVGVDGAEHAGDALVVRALKQAAAPPTLAPAGG